MKIKVHYFASLREDIGRSEDTLESSETSLNVTQVWRLATGKDVVPNTILVALNQEYVDLTAQVSDGDEVAFFPPVTGG